MSKSEVMFLKIAVALAWGLTLWGLVSHAAYTATP